MARKKGGSRRGVGVDAYLAFAIFTGVGVATWSVRQLVRLTVMWLVLLVFTLVYASGRRLQTSYSYSDLGRGLVAGLLISVPVTLLARDFLLVTSQRLFPTEDILTLVWGLVLLMPAVEAVYFRGYVQGEKGLWPAVLLYAAGGAVYCLPATWADHLPVLAALVVSMGFLGFVYSYVRALHGIVASVACQAIVHCVLFLGPSLAERLMTITP